MCSMKQFLLIFAFSGVYLCAETRRTYGRTQVGVPGVRRPGFRDVPDITLDELIEHLEAIVPQVLDIIKQEIRTRHLFFNLGVDLVKDAVADLINVNANILLNSFKKSNAFSRESTSSSSFIIQATSMLVKIFILPRDELLRLSLQPLTELERTLLKRVRAPKCPFNRRLKCTMGKQAKYRTASGVCNNLGNPLQGSANTPLVRWLPADYDDSVSSPRTKAGTLPSARRVSRVVHENSRSSQSYRHVSHMTMQWGQFLDHDITLTPITRGESDSLVNCCEKDLSSRAKSTLLRSVQSLRQKNASSYGTTSSRSSREEGQRLLNKRSECFPLLFEKNDPAFPNVNCINFARAAPTTNINCQLGPREQLNAITSYIDASNVYGSSKKEQHELRSLKNGLLKTSPGLKPGRPFLPKNLNEANCFRPKNNPKIQCFKAGDERANEQVGLTSMHLVWVREHNKIVSKLRRLNPRWKDEKLFQEGRKIVAAMMQHITYSEFLRVIFGQKERLLLGLAPEKHGYNNVYMPNLDASIRNGFATAAYRFGHTLIPAMLDRVTTRYRHGVHQPVKYVDAFFQPLHIYNISQGGPDSVVRGLLSTKSETCDRYVTADIHERLFKRGRDPGNDLMALNIQRGRDHGLPSYMEYRRFCRLPTTNSFNNVQYLDFTRTTIRQLRKVYGNPGDIDVFTGLISEKISPGAIVGKTLICLLGKQFQLSKFGDRFWYENNPSTGKHAFTHAQLHEIRKISLSKVLCENMNIPKVQKNAFLTSNFPGNYLISCHNLPAINLLHWKERRGWGPGTLVPWYPAWYSRRQHGDEETRDDTEIDELSDN